MSADMLQLVSLVADPILLRLFAILVVFMLVINAKEHISIDDEHKE